MAVTKGQNLIGRIMGSCVLESVLGYGGTSAVFLAQQQQPERKVAVKVFLPHNGLDGQMPKDFYQRFLREAEAASKLDHPNILPVYAYGQQDGLPYIIMPYMPGGTLADYIRKHGALSLQETAWYLEQIASALDYAHEQDCVHCDVKPANILLDSDGRIRISDFGIARVHDSANGAHASTRPSDALAGTPDYISPEQALGLPVDGRSDTYSTAITLFYLLAKQLPFNADTPIALALLHVHKPPPSLARIRSDVTDGIDTVLHKALAKKPDERHQTVSELSKDFAEAVEDASHRTSSKRAVVLLSSTGQLSGPLPSSSGVNFSPSSPLSSVVQRVGITRLLGLAFLLFSLIITGSFVTILSLSRNHPVPPQVSTSLTTPNGSANHDLLEDHDGWPTNTTFFYNDGEYHIRDQSPDNLALAFYHPDRPGNYADFTLTVTMVQVHRPDHQSDYQTDYYGVVFRASNDQNSYYLFEVDPANGNQYIFMRYRYEGGLHWDSLANGTVPSLNGGIGKSNTLSIQARGNSFLFKVNDKQVGKAVSDTIGNQPLSKGLVGLYVENKGSEVAFSHLYVDPL